MTLKIYNGSSWQTLKSLKIIPPGPGPWTVAKKGWIYNGSAWSVFYPEFPSSSSNPTISVTSGANGRIGCQYTANAGTWNADDAYVPTSYAYQWTRSSLDISGATDQSYVTTASDADKIIGVKVTATNNRGSTTSTSNTGTPMLPVVSNFTATDSTQSVSAPTVTFNVSNLSFSGSWTAVSNATTYETTYGGTASSTSVDISNRTFGGNGSAGSASFSVRAVNTNRVVSLSWAAAPGASSYDIYIGGSLHTNITSTSYTYNPPDDNSRTYTIYPRTSTTQGYGSSQISLAAPTKYSSYGTGSGTLIQPNPPSGGSVSLTPSGTQMAGTTINASTSFSTGNPIAYETQIRKSTGTSPTDENTGTQVAFSSSSSTSHAITTQEASGTPDHFAAFGRAYSSAGGWSPWVKSNTVISTPYVAPAVIPSGGSVSLSGGTTTGSTLSASTTGWANTPTSYFIKITRGTANVISSESTVASSNSTSTSYSIASGDVGYYFRAFATASNSAGTSSEAQSSELGPVTSSVSAPGTPSVSQNYDGLLSGFWTWTLTINQGSGGTPTGYDWELQLSDSNTASVDASTSGSVTGSGTKTVTRNSSTYSYARWRARAKNSAGNSSWSSYTAWL